MMTRLYRLLLLCAVIISSNSVHAQAPSEFNFQAVARNVDGSILSHRDVRVRLTIRNESPNGDPSYAEIRNVKTNFQGGFTIAVGRANAFYTTGTLDDVKWEEGKKYLQVEIDPMGGSNYYDMGTNQLLSVPFAIYALNSGGLSSGQAGNGLSVLGKQVQLGNEKGDSSARLLSSRELPLNGHSFKFIDGDAAVDFSKNFVTIQQPANYDYSTGTVGGGPFLTVNPIFPAADALPFLFSRTATKQHDGATSPNEVVMWGHNLAGGGGAHLQGLPGIGYSIESNYKPTVDSRLVESHEFYITPAGRQIRLKSYTINTANDHIDFYHTTHNFYLKDPVSGNPYLYLQGNPNYSEAWFGTMYGSFFISTSGTSVQLSNNFGSPGRTFRLNNWDEINIPSLVRVNNIGYNQLILTNSYTPSSSKDPHGETGSMSWDEKYIYIKTENGWKRSALQSF